LELEVSSLRGRFLGCELDNYKEEILLKATIRVHGKSGIAPCGLMIEKYL